MRRPAGRCRTAPRLAAVGLMIAVGTALANPWGLPGETAGSRDGRPPPPDWIQGTEAARPWDTNAWGGTPGTGGYGSATPPGGATDPDPGALPARTTWGGRAPSAQAAPGGPTPWPDAAAPYRFRPDAAEPAGDQTAEPGWRVPSLEDAGEPTVDYRFRGQPFRGQDPVRRTDSAAWPDLGGYRFRPLTERERARQGQDGPARQEGGEPVPMSPFGPGPAWGPRAP